MGKSISSQIIEFEGIAGCGKSTLCSNFAKILKSKGISFVYSQEIAKYMHDHPLSYIRAFRIRNVASVIRLMFSTGTFKSYKYHIAIFKLLSLYDYYSRTSNENVLLCDHSIIQSTVQIWGYNRHTKVDESIRHALSKFFTHTYSTVNVYCTISPKTAGERIRKRNRTYGRLDLIKNDNELVEYLKNNVDNLDATVKVYETLHKVHRLEMQDNPSVIAEELFNKVYTAMSVN